MILTVLTSSCWEKRGWVEKKMREEGEWKNRAMIEEGWGRIVRRVRRNEKEKWKKREEVRREGEQGEGG